MFVAASPNDECSSRPILAPALEAIAGEGVPRSLNIPEEKISISTTTRHFVSSLGDNALEARSRSSKPVVLVVDSKNETRGRARRELSTHRSLPHAAIGKDFRNATGDTNAEEEPTLNKGNADMVSPLEKSRMKKRSLERELAAWKTGTFRSRLSRRNSTGSYDELPPLVDCDEPKEPQDVLEGTNNEVSCQPESGTRKSRCLFRTGTHLEDDSLLSLGIEGCTLGGTRISSPNSLPPLVDCDDNESDEDESLRIGSYNRSLTNLRESSVEAFDDDSVTITIKTQRGNLSHLLLAIKNHGTPVATLSSTLDEEESIFSMVEFPPRSPVLDYPNLDVPKAAIPKKKRGRRSSMGSAPQVNTGNWIVQLFDQGSRRQANSSRESRTTPSDMEATSSVSSSDTPAKSSYRFPRWNGSRGASIGSMTPIGNESQIAVHEMKSQRDNPSGFNPDTDDSPRPSSQNSLGKPVTNEQTRPNSSKSILTSSTRSVATSNSSKCSSSSLNSRERSDLNRNCINSGIPSSNTTLLISSRAGNNASASSKALDDQNGTTENKTKPGTKNGDPETVAGSRTTSKPSLNESPKRAVAVGSAAIDWSEACTNCVGRRFHGVHDSTDIQSKIRQQRRGSTGGCYPLDSSTCKGSIDADFTYPAATQKFAQHLDSKHVRRMSGKLSEYGRSSHDLAESPGFKGTRRLRRASTGGEDMVEIALTSSQTHLRQRKVETYFRSLGSSTVMVPKQFAASPTLTPSREQKEHSTGSVDVSRRKIEDHLDSNHLREIVSRDIDVLHESLTDFNVEYEKYPRQPRRHSTGGGYPVDSPFNSIPKKLREHLDGCTVNSSPSVVAEPQKHPHQERRNITGGGFSGTSENPTRNLEGHLDSHHVRKLKLAAPQVDGRECQERRKSTGDGHYFESPYASYPRELVQQLDSGLLGQNSSGALVSTRSSPNLAPITTALRKEASLRSFSRSDSRLSLHSGSVEHHSPLTSFKSSTPSGSRSAALSILSPQSPGKVKSRPIGDCNSQQLDGADTPRSKRKTSKMPFFRQCESSAIASPEKQKSSRTARQTSNRSKGETAGEVDASARADNQSKFRPQRRASTGSSSAYVISTTQPKKNEEENMITVEKKGAGRASRLGIGLLRGSKNEFPRSKQRWHQ
jgi:hypothetical protein